MTRPTDPSTLAWATVGDLVVAATSGVVPQDATWNAYVDTLRTYSYRKYLHVAIAGTEVTSIQRKEAFEAFSAKKAICAVVTGSAVVRGIVTAASWFGVDVKAFKISEISAAFEHLGIEGEQRQQAAEVVNSLRQRLGE